MARHTHRQLLTWLVWLRDQWNNPSRADYYLMRVALEVRASAMAEAGSKFSGSLDDFRINFKWNEPQPAIPQEEGAGEVETPVGIPRRVRKGDAEKMHRAAIEFRARQHREAMRKRNRQQ